MALIGTLAPERAGARRRADLKQALRMASWLRFCGSRRWSGVPVGRSDRALTL